MTRSPTERVADILRAIDKCRRYRTEFTDSSPAIAELVSDAALRNIENIGEAVKHLPKQITDAHPEIPWAAIVGMRNNLIHQYFGTDLTIVDEVIERDLLPLEAVLKPYAPPQRSAPPLAPFDRNRTTAPRWEAPGRGL